MHNYVTYNGSLQCNNNNNFVTITLGVITLINLMT